MMSSKSFNRNAKYNNAKKCLSERKNKKREGSNWKRKPWDELAKISKDNLKIESRGKKTKQRKESLFQAVNEQKSFLLGSLSLTRLLSHLIKTRMKLVLLIL
jgi:hypothetical protein